MNPGKIDLLADYAAPASGGTRIDDAGAALPTFSPAVPLWVGRLTPPSSTRTGEAGGGARSTASSCFLARWSSSFADGGRLTVEGRDYDILAVQPVPRTPRRSWVHLFCSHVTGVNTATNPGSAFP